MGNIGYIFGYAIIFSFMTGVLFGILITSISIRKRNNKNG